MNAVITVDASARERVTGRQVRFQVAAAETYHFREVGRGIAIAVLGGDTEALCHSSSGLGWESADDQMSCGRRADRDAG